jgi:transposase
MEPLLPVREKPVHPRGRHRQRIPDRLVLNTIFYLLRTGKQWKNLSAHDPMRYAHSSTAHGRFQE